MNLSRRDRKAVALGAAALVVVLAARLVVLPWLGSWGSARARIATGRRQLEEARTKVLELLVRQERLAETYGASAASPPEDIEAARIGFLKTTQAVLRAAGVRYTSIAPQPTRSLRGALAGLEWVPFQVKATCRLPQLAKCLAEMRRAERLVIVERIDARSAPKEPGQLQVTLVLATLARRAGRGS